MAVLGQREKRYLGLAARLEHHLDGVDAVRWTAASLGAVRLVLHLDSVRLVVRMAAALRSGPPHLAGLLHDALVVDGQPESLACQYRICGDPLAPLAGEEGAMTPAHALYAPAADEHLQEALRDLAAEIAAHAETRFGIRYDEATLVRVTTLRLLAEPTEERLDART